MAEVTLTLSPAEVVWLSRATGKLCLEFLEAVAQEEEADAPTHPNFTPAVVQAWRDRAAMLANLQRKLDAQGF